VQYAIIRTLIICGRFCVPKDRLSFLAVAAVVVFAVLVVGATVVVVVVGATVVVVVVGASTVVYDPDAVAVSVDVTIPIAWAPAAAFATMLSVVVIVNDVLAATAQVVPANVTVNTEEASVAHVGLHVPVVVPPIVHATV